MTPTAAIETVLRDHARYAWDSDAAKLVESLPIHHAPLKNIGDFSSGLFIPSDIPFDPNAPPVTADCLNDQMTMLHPFVRDDFPGCSAVEGAPWLWRTERGALMLAFNLSGFIDRFLDFGEEREITTRDRHGRLPPEASTLVRQGVSHLPLLNTYLFAVLGVAKAFGTGQAVSDPSAHVLPPVLVLSHDCDQLRGNDLISQATRIYRMLAPLTRLRPPDLSNVLHVLENALFPRRYFFDDALAMSETERRLGFRSAFYFLNGKGGRLGARSGSPIIGEFALRLPRDAELGVHYNYRYVFDKALLEGQIRELESLTGRTIRSGRAHYLAFDPNESFGVLDELGIRTDESMGFSSLNAFRLGFAGAFRTWRGLKNGAGPVVEIPMHFMDSNTAPRSDEHDLLRMAAQVEKVGGVVTLLYHPGAFDTRENVALRGLYTNYLTYFRERGYRSMLPSELGDLLTQQQDATQPPSYSVFSGMPGVDDATHLGPNHTS